MELKIGEKIRELRKRDGRTQEEVAEALGVSNQAVSKWESQSGYPDMETVPALANYFGVTIDELFGYDGEWEARIREIMQKADAILNRQGEMEDCILLLRGAVQEFPANADLLVRLGYALNYEGWRKYGGRSYTDEAHPHPTPDTAYNLRNEYWEEAAAVFERTLGMNLGTEDRETVIPILLNIYSERGETDKADALARKAPTVRNGREVLLTMVWNDSVRKHNGECLLALLDLFCSQLIGATAGSSHVGYPETIRLLRAAVSLCDSLFPDGNCQYAHVWLAQLYTFLTNALVMERYLNGEPDGPAAYPEAAEAFRKALDHIDAYDAAFGHGTVRFTQPLFAEVEWDSGSDPRPEPDYSSVMTNVASLLQGGFPQFLQQLEAEPRVRAWNERRKDKAL